MIHQTRRSQPKSNSWQRLLAPMLFLSLGLHGLLLLIPVGSSDEAIIPPPDPAQDNIAITRIPPTAPQNKQSPEQVLTASTPVARSVQTAPTQGAAQPPATNSRSQPRARRTAQQTQPQQTQQRGARATTQATVPNLASSTTVTTPAPPPPSLSLPTVERAPFNPTIRQRLLAHAQTLTRTQEQLSQLTSGAVQQYVYTADNTSGEAFGNNLARWVTEIKQATGSPDLWNEALDPSPTLKHYRRVCLTPPPQKAVVGALVSPTGAIQGTPTLLQSTGYPFLNTAVLETVSAYPFPSSGVQKAYTIDVSVQVDYGKTACLEPYTLSP